MTCNWKVRVAKVDVDGKGYKGYGKVYMELYYILTNPSFLSCYICCITWSLSKQIWYFLKKILKMWGEESPTCPDKEQFSIIL